MNTINYITFANDVTTDANKIVAEACVATCKNIVISAITEEDAKNRTDFYLNTLGLLVKHLSQDILKTGKEYFSFDDALVAAETEQREPLATTLGLEHDSTLYSDLTAIFSLLDAGASENEVLTQKHIHTLIESGIKKENIGSLFDTIARNAESPGVHLGAEFVLDRIAFMDEPDSAACESPSTNNEEESKVADHFAKAISEKQPCSICQEEFTLSAEPYLTRCSHIFHKNCFQDYVSAKERISVPCPICREICLFIDAMPYSVEKIQKLAKEKIEGKKDEKKTGKQEIPLSNKKRNASENRDELFPEIPSEYVLEEQEMILQEIKKRKQQQ